MTIDGINFFGVQIEMVQIDDSPPAPFFKAICRPNRLTKGQITLPGHGLYHNFWERFALYLNKNGSAVTLTSSERRQWNHAASPHFRYVVSTGGGDNPHVIAMLGRKQEGKERYRRLLPHRQEIESAVRPCNNPIDAFFHWTEESQWNDSRVRIEQRHNTVDFLDEGQWPTLFLWLREK